MKTWRVLALALAGAMIATPALAQYSGGGATPQTEQKPGSTGAPTTSPSTGGDAAKPDTMKSDRMKSDRMKSGNREQVKAAQDALKQKGFDPGAADGVMGPKTKAALKDFQKAEKLNETGRLDAETMAKLGVQAKADGGSPAASPRMGDSSSASPQTGTAAPKAGGEPSDTEKKSPASPAPSGAPKKQNP
jgi:peptidoglycan hydrolase-like protein with peptidoglycan-binding domain